MTIAVQLDRLATIELETARAGTTGPALLFLHGLGGNCRSWDPQLRQLGSTFRCVAWTMPGYGRSSAPSRFDFASLADAVGELIEHLDCGAATVIGHSMGGYVAQELALRHPNLVDRLILAGTTSAFGKPGSDFNRDFLAARLAPLETGQTPADLAPSVVDAMLGPSAPSHARQAAIDSMSATDVEGYRRALATLVTWNARDRLSAIDLPTLCIAGGRDTTAPPKAVARLAEAIEGAEYREIAEADHLMNLEAPDAFSRLVADFCR